MRNEAARLRRQRRDVRSAVAELVEAAAALADHAIAQAPNRYVPETELAIVEAGIVDIVLAQARAAHKEIGASPLRHTFLEGPALEAFRKAFGQRFREQAELMLSQHGGTA